MVRNVLYLVAAGVILLTGCVSVVKTEHTAAAPQHVKKPVQVLRHVVLFKFKDGTTTEQVRKIESDFCALPSKIDAIQDFEWGTDVGTENRAQGFTHCFLVTFLSEADLDKYVPHPAHKEFADMLGQHLDKVLVVDYWAK